MRKCGDLYKVEVFISTRECDVSAIARFGTVALTLLRVESVQMGEKGL